MSDPNSKNSNDEKVSLWKCRETLIVVPAEETDWFYSVLITWFSGVLSLASPI
jgi:hypothetical protein